MSLSKLELVGFKSFMSPIAIQFREGITAILGPNGCGKTNIVDAVRWVLGEQSPRQLRSNKMENVIFNGTQIHKPTGYAQVSMTIDNSRGVFPMDYAEITISRKVYRSGVSEYFINKAPCRLKDIKELFADTGTGSHSYAVIEQEMIDYVLNDVHGERRLMFEEAAGIVKYRMRREEAGRKLKLTETDLVRLEDILEELGKQVRSLRYQVGKAKRYQRIRDRITSWELVLTRADLSRLLGERRLVERELAEAHERSQHEHESLGETQRLVEEGRLGLLSLEDEHRRLQNRRYEIRKTLQESEEKIIQLTERRGEAERMIERAGREREEASHRLESIAERIGEVSRACDALESRIEEKRLMIAAREGEHETARQEIETLKTRMVELKQTQLDFLQEEVRTKNTLEHLESVLSEIERRCAETRERVLSLERETRELEGARAARESELDALGGDLERVGKERERDGEALRRLDHELAEREQSLADRRAECARVRSRHELLERMRENFEGFPAGARHLLAAGDARVKGSLADLLEVDDGYLSALEAVLGGIGDGVVVERFDDAVSIVTELAASNLGRVRFFAEDAEAPHREPAPSPHGSPGRLSSFVRMAAGESSLVESLLGGVHVFETTRDALAFVRSEAGRGADAVTRSGVYFCRGKGIYFTGTADEELSLFGRTEEITRTGEQIRTLEAELAALEDACRAGHVEKQSLASAIAAREEELARLRLAHAAKRDELLAIDRECIGKREQRSHIFASLGEMEESRLEILSKLEEQRLALEMRGDASELGEIAGCESRLAALQQRIAETESDLTENKIACTSLRGDLERKREEVRGLRELESQFGGIIEQRGAEIHSSREESVRLDAEIATQRGVVTEHLERERGCQAELDRLTGRLEGEREKIAVMERELKDLQAERERVFERENELRLALTSLETRMSSLVERGRELFGADLGCYLQGMEMPLDDAERAITREMLETEKRKLESLGPVNLAAVEEYEEKSKRFDFLEAQRSDLVSAKRELEEAIAKINRRARKRFLETFEAVRGYFSETFEVLFEGGEASLSLGNGADPLEADIVIEARPKGKKLQDISLLSGGERALTAMALLFALYKAKPSPFCIFDEVDAPLDDANISRFVRMLKKFQEDTQFIIITHNKRTMGVADFLYGVTMEERGVSRVVSVDMTEIEGVLSNKNAGAGEEYVETPVSAN